MGRKVRQVGSNNVIEEKKEANCFFNGAKSMLVSLNTIIIIISAVLFVTGMILRFDSSIIEEHDETIQGILKQIASMAGIDTSTMPKMKLTDLLMNVAIILIVFGLSIMALSSVGCCGACCKVKVLLMIYAVLLILLMVSQVTVLCLLFGEVDMMYVAMKDPLVNGLKSSYMGQNGTDIVSIAWNYIMKEFDCCGVNSYTDFIEAQVWHTNNDAQGKGNLTTPLACCRADLFEIDDYACAVRPTTNTSNFNVGCFDKIWETVFSDAKIAGAVIAGCFLLQIVLVVSACALFCYLREEREITPLEVVPDDDGEPGTKKAKRTLKDRAKHFLT